VVPVVAALCVHRAPRWAGPVAGLAYSAAAGTVAVRTQLGAGTISVTNNVLIQGLCLVALGCTVSALWQPRPREGRGHDI
jgi:hypothetical protein